MKKFIVAAALTATLGTAPIAVAPAFAQPGRDHDRQWRGDRQWHGDRNDWNPQDSYRRGNYRDRRMGRDDEVYRGATAATIASATTARPVW